MKLYILFLAVTSNAHTLFTTLFVNGQNQGDGTCVREPKDGETATAPILAIASDDMACGKRTPRYGIHETNIFRSRWRHVSSICVPNPQRSDSHL